MTFMTAFDEISSQAFSSETLVKLLKRPTEESRALLLTIPYLDIPITHHNFDLIRHSLNISSHFDLIIRAATAEVDSVDKLLSAINFNKK